MVFHAIAAFEQMESFAVDVCGYREILYEGADGVAVTPLVAQSLRHTVDWVVKRR